MTRKELVEYLNEIENRYSVHRWKMDGIHVWPLIKINLFFNWTHKDDGESEKSQERINKSGVRFFRKIVSSFFALLKLTFKRKSDNCSILFVESDSHRINFEDRFINRYFKPLEEYITACSKQFDVIYFNDATREQTKGQAERTIFFEKYFYAAYIIQRIKFLFRPRNLTLDDRLQMDLVEKGLIESGSQFLQRINAQYFHILAAKYVTRILIKKHKITSIFELCYYSNLRFGVNLAGRERNIGVYEVQHGGMGPEHISYSGWNIVPDGGYKLLPQYFWLWDEPSHNLLNSWIKHQNYHKAFLGGNPWLGYVISNLHGVYEFPEKKKIILYTLQKREIEDYILDAIKQTTDDYEWWIRLHPRKLDSFPDIERTLHAKGVDCKVELKKANDYPLPIILKNASIHLSGFSGSIIEAAQLGTFSIILSDIGVNAFQLYIDNGLAVAALSESSEEIVQSIKKYSNKMSATKDQDLYHYKTVLKNIVSIN